VLLVELAYGFTPHAAEPERLFSLLACFALHKAQPRVCAAAEDEGSHFLKPSGPGGGFQVSVAVAACLQSENICSLLQVSSEPMR
jgi:hypothetical protein